MPDKFVWMDGCWWPVDALLAEEDEGWTEEEAATEIEIQCVAETELDALDRVRRKREERALSWRSPRIRADRGRPRAPRGRRGTSRTPRSRRGSRVTRAGPGDPDDESDSRLVSPGRAGRLGVRRIA